MVSRATCHILGTQALDRELASAGALEMPATLPSHDHIRVCTAQWAAHARCDGTVDLQTPHRPTPHVHTA